MSASALFPVIKTAAEGAAGLSALGTLYLDEDPPMTAIGYYKFANYSPNRPKFAMNTRYVEDHEIQFDIYHNSLSTCATYQDALHTLFDFWTNTISGTVRVIGTIRVMDMIRKTTHMTDKDGKPVFQAVSRYRFTVDKAR